MRRTDSRAAQVQTSAHKELKVVLWTIGQSAGWSDALLDPERTGSTRRLMEFQGAKDDKEGENPVNGGVLEDTATTGRKSGAEKWIKNEERARHGFRTFL